MLICLENKVSLNDIMPVISDAIARGSSVTITPQGQSMKPMLLGGVSTVTISPVIDEIQRYDIPLYRRKNGAYVIHRIIKKKSDGTYVMCGDNQYDMEYGITNEQLIGVLTAFKRRKKAIRCDNPLYKCYVLCWVNTYWLRRGVRWIKNRCFTMKK